MLDLGSGAGADVLISARRVGPTGRAIGLDMTDEMLELARANAAEAGVENVEFVKGYLEDVPLADETVDVVISNCVINLSGDKPRVIREAARVLRPGGRFAVSDVIADPDMDEATRADMAAWTGCIAGALTEAEFRSALDDAGLRRDRDHRDPPRARARRARRSSAPASSRHDRSARSADDPPRPGAATSPAWPRSTTPGSPSASRRSRPALARSRTSAAGSTTASRSSSRSTATTGDRLGPRRRLLGPVRLPGRRRARRLRRTRTPAAAASDARS